MTGRDQHPDAATLTRWLDDELQPERAEAVAAHVAACRACQAEVEGWQAVAMAAAEALPVLSPGFVVRTCVRAVERAPVLPPLWWLGVPPAWRLALAAALLVAAVAGWRLGGAMTPPADPAITLAAALEAPELAALEQASRLERWRQP
ncbi:MAG: zf-HC2 domain-containing protein [Thermoanaerobaculaceae bacterium]|nr:zf-HC2 domain-containing protein [Thermoanaerobaculaceae bacterium]MDI9622277.1 zf-HC2 domain-containing protein [Acidobacteriota bacterium]NLH11894.1 hypothetical protein [Holophagae bacterium]HPW56329.1 zf-HC2 domain-containing protein [Thermoanaerobaculaceae bacterium]